MARKDVAFKIRIDEELRRVFVEACRDQDVPAAQVVREFMRKYVAERQAATSTEGISESEHASTRTSKRNRNKEV